MGGHMIVSVCICLHCHSNSQIVGAETSAQGQNLWKAVVGCAKGRRNIEVTTYCAFSVLSFELHTWAVPDLDPCLEQCLPSNLSRAVQRHQDMPARITSSTPHPVHLHAQCDIKTCSISLTWKQWSIIEVYIDHTSSRPVCLTCVNIYCPNCSAWLLLVLLHHQTIENTRYFFTNLHSRTYSCLY